MPELPEVETIRKGIKPLVVGKKVRWAFLRSTRLRWSVGVGELARLTGQQVVDVERRAKFLIFRFSRNWLVLHMGMTGTLRCVAPGCPPGKHDHFDLVFDDGSRLRFRDPRKFGGIIFFHDSPFKSPFFSGIGPEPFSKRVDGSYLFNAAREKKVAVKNFIMDQRFIAGVGNIYANEALFLSGIRPTCAAGQVTKKNFDLLAENIRRVLARAIDAGGTSFRDFYDGEGRPGYFSIQLNVYGKGGEPCPQCGQRISTVKIGQRSTFFCSNCQK